ncbi:MULTISPECIES: pyrroline-5-carboxylate reductase [unclassified Corynebacterium]|uniref:pyrroline-5-carboxylate reductase n=1 Tax=unclassified Corynebacterium TaxID=2624378 RepID=UPI002A91D688|nr:pyrroline-5-carboxylate reductase [Corynebacterium sp.]MDY5786031.1 pyrroline-5-carboxylate reductase [Corynebacterium sp.]
MTKAHLNADKIAVIGAGNIGEALISGLVAAGVDPQRITATNRTPERGAQLTERYGILTTGDNSEAAADADVVFLCVKPKQVVGVIEEIGETIARNETSTALVSMAAGITLTAMESAVCAAGTPVARVMPNTPMLVGKGVHLVSFGRFVEDAQREQIAGMLEATGEVVGIDESLIDAATAVSGSGPAYFFLLTESLIDAGVALGLPRETAVKLATATAAGAGEMLAGESSPAELRHAVSSPAGTTVAAIRELEESGLRGAMYRATDACARRARELGK